MINSSNLRKLSQMDLFQVINNMLSFLQAEDLTALHLKKVYDSLLEAFTAYDDAVIQDRKTGLTDPLGNLDNERDLTLSGFISCLKGYTNLLLPAKQEAAKRLLSLTEKYPYIQRLASREETASIINLLQELKTDQYAAAITLLGLTDFVTLLEEKNTAYQNLYNERTSKEAQIKTGLAKTTRNALESAFRDVANAINGLEIIYGKETYRVLSDKINREIARAN